MDERPFGPVRRSGDRAPAVGRTAGGSGGVADDVSPALVETVERRRVGVRKRTAAAAA